MLDLQKRFGENDEFLEPDWLVKENCRVRFNNLPEQDIRNRLTFPTNDDVGKFVQIKGKFGRIKGRMCVLYVNVKMIFFHHNIRNRTPGYTGKIFGVQNGLHLWTLQSDNYNRRGIW